MKKLIILFAFIPIIFSSYGCKENSTENEQDFNFSNLYKEWQHSYEEEIDSVQIYRPSDFKEFQASWYRQVYKFHADNSCKYLVLSPTDAHYFDEGTWSYISPDEILTISDQNGNMVAEYRIIELNENILKLNKTL